MSQMKDYAIELANLNEECANVRTELASTQADLLAERAEVASYDALTERLFERVESLKIDLLKVNAENKALRAERDELLADVHQPELCREEKDALRRENAELRRVLAECVEVFDVMDQTIWSEDSDFGRKDFEATATKARAVIDVARDAKGTP